MKQSIRPETLQNKINEAFKDPNLSEISVVYDRVYKNSQNQNNQNKVNLRIFKKDGIIQYSKTIKSENSLNTKEVPVTDMNNDQDYSLFSQLVNEESIKASRTYQKFRQEQNIKRSDISPAEKLEVPAPFRASGKPLDYIAAPSPKQRREMEASNSEENLRNTTTPPDNLPPVDLPPVDLLQRGGKPILPPIVRANTNSSQGNTSPTPDVAISTDPDTSADNNVLSIDEIALTEEVVEVAERLKKITGQESENRVRDEADPAEEESNVLEENEEEEIAPTISSPEESLRAQSIATIKSSLRTIIKSAPRTIEIGPNEPAYLSGIEEAETDQETLDKYNSNPELLSQFVDRVSSHPRTKVLQEKLSSIRGANGVNVDDVVIQLIVEKGTRYEGIDDGNEDTLARDLLDIKLGNSQIVDAAEKEEVLNRTYSAIADSVEEGQNTSSAIINITTDPDQTRFNDFANKARSDFSSDDSQKQVQVNDLGNNLSEPTTSAIPSSDAATLDPAPPQPELPESESLEQKAKEAKELLNESLFKIDDDQKEALEQSSNNIGDLINQLLTVEDAKRDESQKELLDQLEKSDHKHETFRFLRESARTILEDKEASQEDKNKLLSSISQGFSKLGTKENQKDSDTHNEILSEILKSSEGVSDPLGKKIKELFTDSSQRCSSQITESSAESKNEELAGGQETKKPKPKEEDNLVKYAILAGRLGVAIALGVALGPVGPIFAIIFLVMTNDMGRDPEKDLEQLTDFEKSIKKNFGIDLSKDSKKLKKTLEEEKLRTEKPIDMGKLAADFDELVKLDKDGQYIIKDKKNSSEIIIKKEGEKLFSKAGQFLPAVELDAKSESCKILRDHLDQIRLEKEAPAKFAQIKEDFADLADNGKITFNLDKPHEIFGKNPTFTLASDGGLTYKKEDNFLAGIAITEADHETLAFLRENLDSKKALVASLEPEPVIPSAPESTALPTEIPPLPSSHNPSMLEVQNPLNAEVQANTQAGLVSNPLAAIDSAFSSSSITPGPLMPLSLTATAEEAENLRNDIENSTASLENLGSTFAARTNENTMDELLQQEERDEVVDINDIDLGDAENPVLGDLATQAAMADSELGSAVMDLANNIRNQSGSMKHNSGEVAGHGMSHEANVITDNQDQQR